MIKNIKFTQYRKLKDLDFNFCKGVNILSGTNGTCKSSILHLISNSFQAVTASANRCPWVNNNQCLKVIRAVNNVVNPKVETLTRGDKKYNDPAFGIKGNLFTVEYTDGYTLNFRRHISKTITGTRYAVKPSYGVGKKESLPYAPVIYLGLSQLFPYGEYNNDDAIRKLNTRLPDEYQKEISELYHKFTGLNVGYIDSHSQKMGDIKIRSEFETDSIGVDSNTISAGEDNLYIIITSLISLKYYYQSISHNNDVESVLLIDELDATLHPSFQIKLMELLNTFSNEYKIQIIFTSHSLSLLEDALKKKYNVAYLIDNINSVKKMEDPDIYKIKMNLNQLIRDQLYINRSIPVFSEDNEARIFLNLIFDNFTYNHTTTFATVRSFFHLVEASLGADNLKGIFNDRNLLRTTMRSICILDGDRHSQRDLSRYTITLPGECSPEVLAMQHSKNMFYADDVFWTHQDIMDLGYIKTKYRDDILPDILNISETLNQKIAVGESIKGVERELNKNVFDKHKQFFELVLINWIESSINKDSMDKFYNDLRILFLKVAEFHEINPKMWAE
ncbi:MAG: ATP-binding protein [Oscillospiraceae bacterium]|jgi:hypothetical protein|nr:ATP-binding protein [Oscillospiraceae bacterium]